MQGRTFTSASDDALIDLIQGARRQLAVTRGVDS
jgi:hypothetical protein